MRPLPRILLAALVLAGAARPSRAGPLVIPDDLRGGPSPGPVESGPEKDIVLAAIKEFSDYEPAVALNVFQPMFGSMTTPDGRSVAFGERQLKDAAALLARMIESGQIAVKPVSGPGAAGAWTPDVVNGALAGGTFEVGDWRAVQAIGRDPRSFSQLFKQDQFANTVLHETAHMFYSVFTLSYGFKAQSQPFVVEEFRSTVFWNGRRPASLCTAGGSSCPYPHDKRPCADITCYYWKISNQGYGQGNATEYAARVISQTMSEESGGEAYARVLAPAFR
jgi:hypothetical protein